MKKELLPIGSVVLLENGVKTLMISGYKMKSTPDTKTFDYVGCVFPEGFMEENYCLFDSKDIKDVLFIGCMDGFEEYSNKIENGVNYGNSDSFVEGESVKNKPSVRRPKKVEPTEVLSLSEAKAKFSSAKVSGGQLNEFDINSVKESDWRNFIDE